MSSKFVVILRGLQWKWNGIQVEIRFKGERALRLKTCGQKRKSNPKSQPRRL